MKILVILLASSLLAMAGPPPVGSPSKNVRFSVRDGDGFRNVSLKNYNGKIVVIMLMTPWCPICQSHSKAVGDGILDYYASRTRGSLRGKNAKGVEIESILLSTEPAPNWDRLSISFAPTNGFMSWGLDAKSDRSNPRTLLGYFRGGFIRSSNLYDWGDDRRRLVVINLVRDSPNSDFREILINTNAFSSADVNQARAAIDQVQPATSLPLLR